jgi:hypothetical protein
MATIRHKLFSVKIDDLYNVDAVVAEALDEFLSDVNHVYINHSVSSIGLGPGRIDRESVLFLSIVYKDLRNTTNQLTNVTAESKEMVHNSILSGSIQEPPVFETAFDKRNSELLIKSSGLVAGRWECRWGSDETDFEICEINTFGQYSIDGVVAFDLINFTINEKSKVITFIKFPVADDDNRKIQCILDYSELSGNRLSGKEFDIVSNSPKISVTYRRLE